MLARASNWILLTLVLAIAGCGGGGGGGGGLPLGQISLLSNLPGLHDLEQVRIQFADNGNGAAVWVSDSGFGVRLVYAGYSASTGTWSAERVLADFGGMGFEGLQFKLAGGSSDVAVLYVRAGRIYGATYSAGAFDAPQMLDDTGSDDLDIDRFDLVPNGSGYAAVWSRADTASPFTGSVRASVRPASTGVWGPAATLGAIGDEDGGVAGASDGTGHMAVWTNGGNLLGNYYSGGSWQANAVQIDDRPDPVSTFGIASNGLGYQVAWIQNDGTAQSVFTTGFSSTFTRTANVTIDSSADHTSDVSIVSNGTDYLVTWLQSVPADLLACMGSGTAWGLPVVLDDPALPNGVTQEYRVATNGDGCAVMWIQQDAAGLSDVWSRVYSGGWSAPEILDTADGFPSTTWSALASNGNGYAAIWVQSDDGPGNTSSLWANVHDGLSWQGAEVLEGGSDSLNDLPSLANRGANFTVAWSRQTADDTAMLLNVRTFNGGTGTWSAVANLATVSRGGSAGVHQLMGNAAGLTLASWFQRQGRTRVSYVAVQATDGIWGPAVPAEIHSFATNGVGFGVAESRLNPATGAFEAYARIHDGRTWGAPVRLGGLFTGSAGSASIASNGTGYAVVWAQEPTPGANYNIYASLFHGIGWSAPVQLDGATNSQLPQVASNGTGYAATWDGYDDSVVPVNVFDGANWGGQTTVSATSNQVFPFILSNGTGYMIHWTEDDPGILGRSIFASTSPAGTAAGFSPAEKISTGLKPVSFVYAAFHGTGYGVTWLEGDDFITGFVHASVWDGTWSAAARVGTGTNPELEPSIAGSNAGFGVTWKQQDTGDSRPVTLRAAIYSGGVWGAPVPLETQDEPVDGFAEYHGGIASNGTTYAVTWSQLVNAAIGDGRHHVFASVFDGTTWKTTQIENRAAESVGTVIETVGGKYSVMWTQSDPAGDPGVLLPWMYKGLE